MKVIKLGGSLMQDAPSLIHCLDTIEQNKSSKIVVVPGGGCFADQVRIIQQQWKFDDYIAHQMAILAMKQMALLFKSIKQSFVVATNISAIRQALLHHSIVIWSPDIEELESSDIESSWDVSSDSLAAWLANQLTVEELILVKSAEIPVNLDIQQLQKQNLIDKAFIGFTKNTTYTVTVINKHRFNEYPHN